MRPIAPALLVLLAACSTGAGDEVADPALGASRGDARQLAEYRPVGESQQCVQTTRIRSTRVLSDRVIDFELAGGRRLRNTLPVRCPSLGFEERFSYSTYGSQLCSSEIITVLRSPSALPGPSCGLGRFQPVERAPAAN